MNLVLKIAAAVTIGILLYLMLGPAPAVQGSAPGIDKVAHLFAFATIAACLMILFPRSDLRTLSIGTLLLGGIIELIQGQIGRDASGLDFLFDGLGVSLFWLAGLFLQRWRSVSA